MTKLNQDGLYDVAAKHSHMKQMSASASSNVDALYDFGGLYAKVIDKPAEDCLAKGFTIHGDADGKLQADIDRLRVSTKAQDIIRWGELHGGAVIVPILKNRVYADFMTPFNPQSQYTVEAINIYPVDDFIPTGDNYTDATNPKFGQPEYYYWNNVIIHESRMIGVRGAPWAKPNTNSNPFKGRSVALKQFQAVSDYYDACNLSMRVLERKQQAVYQMKGLAEALAEDKSNNNTENEQIIQKRIALVDHIRSLLNTVIIDKGDGESVSGDEFILHDMNLSGLDTVVGIYQTKLSAETSIPVSILFGESPKGLNATGNGDWQGYYTKITSLQSRYLKPAFERLVALLANQTGITGLAEDWSIEFNPLEELSEKELAEIDKMKADTAKTHADAINSIMSTGVASPEHIEQYLVTHELFGFTPDTSVNEAKEYAAETS